MKLPLQILSRKSGLGVLGVLFGSAWKLLEIIHTAAFLRMIVLKISHSHILAHVAGSQLPPYGLIAFGCMWSLYFELRYRAQKNAQGHRLSIPSQSAPIAIANTPATLPDRTLPLGDVIAEAKDVVSEASELVVRQTTTEIIIRRTPDKPAA